MEIIGQAFNFSDVPGCLLLDLTFIFDRTLADALCEDDPSLTVDQLAATLNLFQNQAVAYLNTMQSPRDNIAASELSLMLLDCVDAVQGNRRHGARRLR